MYLTKNNVEKAFVDFDNGARPERAGTPKGWYVKNKDEKPYPLKIIFGLATGRLCVSDGLRKGFITFEARDELERLGYECFDKRIVAKKVFNIKRFVNE